MKLQLAREARRLHAKHSLISEALFALRKKQNYQGVSIVIETLSQTSFSTARPVDTW